MLRKTFILWSAIFVGAMGLLSPVVHAQDKEAPKVALVLSGGGARGFSHVGVIKVLHELGIKVDIVTGTSMGAMVGGGYASGYSIEQMREIILSVNWDEMFAPRPDRSEINWRKRQDDFKGLSDSEMGFTPEGIKVATSVVPAQRLETFLRQVTRHVSSVDDLTQLAIPFAAIATDLDNGEAVVMQKDVTLAEAMRASMSVPGAFPPVPRNGRYLVDGGLAQNLPVEQARAMGADIIIAVNAGTPLGKAQDIHSIAGIAGQVIGILTERNVDASKAQLGPDDILITTQLQEFTAADFKKADQIIAAGEKSAREHISELKRLAVSQQAFNQWNVARESAVVTPPAHQITSVRVQDLQTVNPQSVIEEAGLDISKPVTEDELERAAARVWASSDFTLVPYQFEPGPNGTQTLVWQPTEKPWGYNTLRIGGKLSTDFNQEHTFTFLLAHTMQWVNRWGGEWRNEAQIGKQSYFSTSFYQPLGLNSPFFVMPEIRYDSERYDWYDDSGRALATIKNRSTEVKVSLGMEFSDDFVATVGGGWIDATSEVSVGLRSQYEGVDDRAMFAEMALRYDTLDNINFPTKGFYLNAEARRYDDLEYSTDPSVSDYSVEAILPIDWGDGWVSVLNARRGASSIPSRYALGGLFNMSGAYYGRYNGSDIFFGNLILYKRLKNVDVLGFPLYVGGSAEFARVKEDSDTEYAPNEDWGQWKKAGSVFVATNTIFGPMYLALGRTSDQDSAVYFFWGRPYQ